ncbi:MAG: mercuric ion transporter MerT [Rhodoferax sp.]
MDHPSDPSRLPLATGGLAALLASTCCLGPLVLVSLGISGAWIGQLTALEPYQPWFIGVALVSLLLAWRRIYRPAPCASGAVCALPRTQRLVKGLFWLVVALVGVALAYPYVLPWFY